MRSHVGIEPFNQILLQKHIIYLSGLEYVAASIQVTIGYREDRSKIESLLIESAKNTDGIIENPQPHVILFRFDESGSTYELRAYTNKPNEYFEIQSRIRKRIYDVFQKNGLDITTIKVLKNID